MSANKTRFLLVTLLALVGTLAMMGQRPVSAALVPAPDAGASVASLSASLQVTATATLTATKTLTPTVAAATATKTLTPTVAAATATKTLTPTVAAATATKTLTPTVAAATATKTVTPTVAAATATKTATRAPATATKTATAAPTKTATTAARLGPRAGTVSSLSTQFVVQNMDASTTANVTGTFYDASGSSAGTNAVNATIPPNRNAIIDQRGSGGGLDSQTSWQGSVVLSSNTQLAAVVNEFGGNSSSGMDFRFDNYNGLLSTSGATSVILPQVIKNIYDSAQNITINSTIAIQNTSLSAPATVSITYYNTSSGNVTRSGIQIPAGSSVFIDMQNELAGISSWMNAASVSSNQPVAVVVNQSAAGALYVYLGFTNANSATTLYLPQLLYNVYDGQQGFTWGTGMMVMTADQSSADVTVTYYNGSGGIAATSTKTASPAAIFDQRVDMPAAGMGTFYGSAIISSSKPIVALTNITTNYNSSRGLRVSTARAFANGTGANTVFVPQLLKNVYDSGTNITWSTGLQGELMGASSATVTLTYYFSDGTTRTSTANVTPSSPIFLFDQRFDGALADLSTATAAAVLTSSQPFAVTINMVGDSNAPGDSAGTYAGITQ